MNPEEIRVDRIIITNRTTLSNMQAMRKIYTVMDMGLMSDHKTKYCFHTVFDDDVEVSAIKTSYGYRFELFRLADSDFELKTKLEGEEENVQASGDEEE